MDPVDVLSTSVMAAQLIRSAANPEAVIAGAYGVLNRDPPIDRDEAIEVRIVRLMSEAGESRRVVLDHLRECAGPLPLNRPDASDDRATEIIRAEADPEAVRLAEFVEGEVRRFQMIPEGQGPFSIAERKVMTSFDGPETEGLGPLPKSVRGLIDYPLAIPVLFDIETGDEPWDVWEIFYTFVDQYVKIS
jgi:hypothetical protein